MKEKSNYWDTQFTDLSQFLMAIQKLAEKKQETLQENKNKKAIENLTKPVKPVKKQRKKKKKASGAKTSRLGVSNMDTYMSEEELQKRKEKREKRKRREARKKRREGRKK